MSLPATIQAIKDLITRLQPRRVVHTAVAGRHNGSLGAHYTVFVLGSRAPALADPEAEIIGQAPRMLRELLTYIDELRGSHQEDGLQAGPLSALQHDYAYRGTQLELEAQLGVKLDPSGGFLEPEPGRILLILPAVLRDGSGPREVLAFNRQDPRPLLHQLSRLPGARKVDNSRNSGPPS